MNADLNIPGYLLVSECTRLVNLHQSYSSIGLRNYSDDGRDEMLEAYTDTDGLEELKQIIPRRQVGRVRNRFGCAITGNGLDGTPEGVSQRVFVEHLVVDP